MNTPRRVVYVVVCGAGPAGDVGTLLELAQQRGWTVCVIATPAALNLIDSQRLERQSGHPVRHAHRTSVERQAVRGLPRADGIIVAPATFNTINKWAAGISDTYALDVLAEAIGLGIPAVVLPFVNQALAAHPAFRRSVAELRAAGVRILLGPDGFEPHPAGTGGSRLAAFPWHLALDRL